MKMKTWKIRPPKIHWRKYVTRKVIFLATFAIVSPYIAAWVHVELLSHAHELAVGTLFEHLIFGIPMEE